MVKIAITLKDGVLDQVLVSDKAEVAVIELDEAFDPEEVYAVPSSPGKTFLGKGRLYAVPGEVITADAAALVSQVKAGRVKCDICGYLVDADKAHNHQGDIIGDACCWDELLRSSE